MHTIAIPSITINDVYSINDSCIVTQYTLQSNGAFMTDMSITAKSSSNQLISQTINTNANMLQTDININTNVEHIWCNQLQTYETFTIMLSATNEIGTYSVQWNQTVCLETIPQSPEVLQINRVNDYSSNATIFLNQPNVNYCLKILYCICVDYDGSES